MIYFGWERRMNQNRQRININKELMSLINFLNYRTYSELTAMNISSVGLLIQKKNEINQK